ncbi:HpcH/HpaI aldolase/citrate lyase family protein [Cupriavidus necator]|uniref:HpcH/HpaI aldolase/citrate lyase family protein n=1 Tax=Cupriavidus necator TaxID=106590 RepID=UPI00129DA23E|nr:CoA ester lyase [Cupriavidus necator]
MNLPRSYLFVPGDRPERFQKALASGAGQVIIDLEDAVNPEAKVDARAALRNWLETAAPVPGVCIRVNGTATNWHDEDLALASLPAVQAVILPKTESAAQVRAVRDRLAANQTLIALVESVAGILALREIAQSRAVGRIAFGSVDFCTDAGMQDLDGALNAVRTAIVLESRHACLPAPIDGVSTAIGDPDTVLTEATRARATGFGAKLCIHPSQVAPSNEGFLPTAAERLWARRVIDAIEGNTFGAIAVDGKLIDKPLIQSAHTILAQPKV